MKLSIVFMTDERLEKMGFTPDGWASFVGQIASEYGDGKLISHQWLKEKFGFKKLQLEDFESLEDFLKSYDNQQMAYCTCVESLRMELLKQEKMYFRNVRGDGYSILRPEEQTQYGYDSFVDDIKKDIKKANLIMSNVLQVDLSQQAKDNDLRAKFGVMRQMLGSIKSGM